MRRIHRIVLLAGLVVLAPVLAGCESFDMDKLDVFGLNEKKKLPGDRKPVFPEGVPGVTQGIPPEFVKSNQPPPVAQDNQAAAAAEPAEEPKPKPKPKAKPKTAAQPPARVTVAPRNQQQQTQDQQPQQGPWPAPGQSTSTAPWPSSPAPGTFQR